MSTQNPVVDALEEVGRALAAIGVVGQVEGVDVVRRSSVIDIARDRARMARDKAEERPDLVPVARQDADSYCRLLSLLGMEEEGDPVARVRELLELESAAQVVDAEVYSIDADPDKIRQRACEAVIGALALGAQGLKPPPAGHWLQTFWDIGRAERISREAAIEKTAEQLPSPLFYGVAISLLNQVKAWSDDSEGVAGIPLDLRMNIDALLAAVEVRQQGTYAERRERIEEARQLVSGEAALQARRPSEPPLIGRWHHGEGYLVSGSIRVSRWDCDTNPPAEFRDRLLEWMCETLNAAVRKHELKQPAARAVWPVECRADLKTVEEVSAVDDLRAVVALLEAKEYAEHWAKTDIGKRLEACVTDLIGGVEHEDAARFHWLTDDHADKAVRAKRDELLERMFVMSRSAVSASIDAARKGGA